MKQQTSKDELPLDGSVDAGLYVLSLITPSGVTLTQAEIAEVCGYATSYISAVERTAIEKLRRALQLRRIRGEI